MAVGSRNLARTGHPPSSWFRLPPLSERVKYGLLGFAVVLPLWEAAVRLGLVRRVTLSAPSYIAATAVNDFTTGVIWPHLIISAQEYFVGLLLAIVGGVVFGLVLGSFRRLGFLADPILSALYATPVAALVPLIILIFGLTFTEKIVVIWLKTVLMVLLSTIAGAHAADPRHVAIARSFRASAWRRFVSVTLPTSVPFILTGIRLGAGQALVGVTVAEFLGANAGIGFYITFNGALFRTDRVMLGIIILGLVGITVGELMRRLERRFDRWRPATR